MELPKRKKNRLTGYDYSQNGAYFVTICVVEKQELLWNVGARTARPRDTAPLSQYGLVVDAAILEIPKHYPCIRVDKYCVMPNHIHLILMLQQDDGRAMRAPTTSTVVNQMKGAVTKQIGFSFWQKSLHDRILRNEREYQKIWEYIDTNPLTWEKDCFYRQG
ncbi:transposase [Fumia xinanensis]|uniref:Transposase n=1 Tax=Fumia xinanensis TaxID=2763659 RepID=A0A926E624_9FIRM|nr:transposase [Fumia xinanensis]MBC8560238.1 transposase [Fumia xinanensis]